MFIRAFTALSLCLTLAGCDLPRDPQGTLDRVRGGTMRVGLIEQPPFAEYEDGQPSGIEVTLVRQLAEQLGADIQWTRGGGQHLFEKLERFELDLVIGGVTRSTPWSKRVGLSLPHHIDRHGDAARRRVFAVPPGENGWLSVVDRFAHKHRNVSARLFNQERQP